jgi:hypothetical protein
MFANTRYKWVNVGSKSEFFKNTLRQNYVYVCTQIHTYTHVDSICRRVRGANLPPHFT